MGNNWSQLPCLLPRGASLNQDRIVRLPTPRSYRRILGGNESLVFLGEANHYDARPKVRVASLIPYFEAWRIGHMALEAIRTRDQSLLDAFVRGRIPRETVEKYLKEDWRILPQRNADLISQSTTHGIRLSGLNASPSVEPNKGRRESHWTRRLLTLHRRNLRRGDERTRMAVFCGEQHAQLDPLWAAGALATTVSVLTIAFISRTIAMPPRLFRAIESAGLTRVEFAITGIDAGFPSFHWVVHLPRS